MKKSKKLLVLVLAFVLVTTTLTVPAMASSPEDASTPSPCAVYIRCPLCAGNAELYEPVYDYDNMTFEYIAAGDCSLYPNAGPHWHAHVPIYTDTYCTDCHTTFRTTGTKTICNRL